VIKSILVGMDGSRHSWSAWRYAVDLARAYDATLRLVSVVDQRARHEAVMAMSGGFFPTGLSETAMAMDAEAEEAAKHQLEVARSRSAQEGIEVETRLLRGAPAETIWSAEPQVDLIAVGHRGERGTWDRLLMGSTASDVVRKSARPVLVAPERYRAITKILAAYDGSEPARHALQFAADLASVLKVGMVVLHVTPNSLSETGAIREAKAYLQPYRLAEVQTLVRHGDPAEQILSAASDHHANLIVMGAHGHGMLREVLLGSVAEEVLAKMDRPVLTVR
jgi:nucleotide-binding universal stress UspA family protein